MPRTVELHLNKNIHDTIYGNVLEHLADELRCLDLRIHLQVIKQRIKGQSNSLEQFRGLVLSEEEIRGLLAQPLGQCYDDKFDESSDPDLLAINGALARLENIIHERRAASHEQQAFLPLAHLSNIFLISDNLQLTRLSSPNAFIGDPVSALKAGFPIRISSGMTVLGNG